MEKSANEQPQIGGDHYRKAPGEQLWDRLVRLYGLPACRVFFIGNIQRYVERYQDKDGVKDLLKARHYLDKLIEEEEKYKHPLMEVTHSPLPLPITTGDFAGVADEEMKELEKVIMKWSKDKTIISGQDIPETSSARILCSRGCCLECVECSSKPGTPQLCPDCLERRRLCNSLWVEEKVMKEMDAVTPPADQMSLARKMEPCCECGEDYPRSDLIAGWILCDDCRHHWNNGGVCEDCGEPKTAKSGKADAYPCPKRERVT